MVRVKIFFFGRLGEQLGREREVEIPGGGCTVSELRRRLVDGADPAAAVLLEPGNRACVDQAIVPEGAKVRPGQEVAFFPILSGG